MESGTHSPEICDISDTALWVAVYRARESDRPDAVFLDPFARRLAGERGEKMAAAQPFSSQNDWSFIARTWLFDKYLEEAIAAGADSVLNLAAGLDTRPYRMALPPGLRWTEVDLPGVVGYKNQMLEGETPRCALERIALDLSDVRARRALFARLRSESSRTVVLTEGLLVYLTRDENDRLCADLVAQPSFARWILDIGSPGLLRLLQENIGQQLRATPLQFAPEEGLAFWERHGWRRLKVHSLPHAAAEINRLPEWMRPALDVPIPDPPGDAIWGGVCAFGRPEN